MVWGVGRGSPVASYVLFLLGVHKVDPIQYGLDWREFNDKYIHNRRTQWLLNKQEKKLTKQCKANPIDMDLLCKETN